MQDIERNSCSIQGCAKQKASCSVSENDSCISIRVKIQKVKIILKLKHCCFLLQQHRMKIGGAPALWLYLDLLCCKDLSICVLFFHLIVEFCSSLRKASQAQAWVHHARLTDDSINQSAQHWVNGWKYEGINTAQPQWEDDPALSCVAFPLRGNLKTFDTLMEWNIPKITICTAVFTGQTATPPPVPRGLSNLSTMSIFWNCHHSYLKSCELNSGKDFQGLHTPYTV